jgi:hypothetical protein
LALMLVVGLWIRVCEAQTPSRSKPAGTKSTEHKGSC